MTPAAKLDELLSPAQISERQGKPLLLSPNNSEEISAIARYANQHKLAIEITGAGTKRSWGNAIFPDLLLDTTHLTGILSHSWQDLTATVAAGTPWADMQRVLAAHKQFVALDPLWPETATVGGIIATNDSGPMRLKYGSLRDLIIGMTIVLADGTIAKSGGKVVKNVAGYDLHKLMTGAFGTLGVITEVTFRLHPLPKHSQTFTVSAPQTAALAPLIAAIRDSHLLVEAMQLRGNPDGLHLDIQLNAHPDARHSELLAKMSDSHSLTLEPNAGQVWRIRETLFADNSAFVVKACMLPSEVIHFGSQILALGGTFVAQSSGIMIASFNAPEYTPTNKVVGLRGELEKCGGSLTVLRYTYPSRAGLPANRIDETALPLMREIKQRFDPNRVLNFGRFMGGI